MVLLITAIRGFAQVLIYLLFARAICSWFVRRPIGTAYKIYQILSMVTEPIVAPCRKITQRFPTGMLDLSVLLAMVLVMIISDVLVRLLVMFAL
jgi:YggT family protein